MAASNPALGVPVDLAEIEDYALRDAIVRYNNQVAIVAALRKEWAKLKNPLTTAGGSTGRGLVVHPLLKAIQDAEALADRFMKGVLEKRPVGRPRGATSAPDRQPSSRVKRVA